MGNRNKVRNQYHSLFWKVMQRQDLVIQNGVVKTVDDYKDYKLCTRKQAQTCK